MQQLFTIDTETDLIVVCRLLNIFRRKGVKVDRLTIVSNPAGFSLVLLFEAAEAEIEHIFNFVRRTEGVNQASCYRHGCSKDSPSFALVDTHSEHLDSASWAEFLPRSPWVFASDGKALAETGADLPFPTSGEDRETPWFQSFAHVKTTRGPEGPSEGKAR
jgi:hypothetical protein